MDDRDVVDYGDVGARRRGGKGGGGARFTPYGGGGKGGGGGGGGGSTRVYVHNLSFDTSWQGLKDAFRQAGEVVHAKIMTTANGRSKGCGIVEFATAKQARRAIELMHDVELDGRPLSVREDREDKALGGGGGFGGGKGGKGGGKGGGGKGGGKGERSVKKDASTLDADLDAYWGNNVDNKPKEEKKGGGGGKKGGKVVKEAADLDAEMDAYMASDAKEKEPAAAEEGA